ncbi:metallophosphoesterase [Neorhodopirellula pilleata]|uniref:Putative metallophosphoesterase n=1 Tax=Neorhodopirellula pilleata TaxID=2714738 RepID=A0A5C6AT98_9BACT|nr:metallophosphoesterase [Neorhodopirellula pilleata]TWU03225.1 putative metallophosphoesterase [Neorhodopirellula pilleata]
MKDFSNQPPPEVPSIPDGRTAFHLPAMTRRRAIRAVAGGVLASPALMFSWARWWEPHWLQVNYAPLAIPNLPSTWRGKTIVQMSDLHIGSTDPDYLESVVATVNELRADLLVITGDILDSHFAGSDQTIARLLSPLKLGSVATLACLGNHDYGRRWREDHVADMVEATMSKLGVEVLRDQLVKLDGLDVFGLDDFWSRKFQASKILKQANAGRASVCLCHNPDVVDQPVWGDFQGVILAGHTHGGQCKPPFLKPPKLPVRNDRYVSGFYDVGSGRQLHISRGIGYGLQARFNCRPEVNVFELGTQAGSHR